MDSDIVLHKVNEAWMRVECDPSIARELSEHLTFEVPGAKYSPKFKARIWDGKIRILNSRNMQTYLGLVEELTRFAQERDYTIECDFGATEALSLEEARNYSRSLDLPFEAHDHQIRAFALGVRNSRCILVSPTASGKSLIIYLLTRWYDAKTLILVPNISLVHQLYSDFEDYGFDSESNIHKIFGGQDKTTDNDIVI